MARSQGVPLRFPDNALVAFLRDRKRAVNELKQANSKREGSAHGSNIARHRDGRAHAGGVAVSMIEVFCIPVPKERLLAMPKEDRGLLLLLGYVANQITMLQKLLNFSTNGDAGTELQQIASGVQTQMLVRLMAGALNEAWGLVEKRFISRPIGRDYLSVLEPGGLDALNALKQLFHHSELINYVRNNFGYHLPDTEQTEAAFQAALNDTSLDRLWNFQFSQHGFNSLFLLSDLIFIHGIGGAAFGAGPEDGHAKLLGEMGLASMHLVDFAKAFVAAAWRKYFGPELNCTEVTKINGAPDVDKVLLPFFVEMHVNPTDAGSTSSGSPPTSPA
jgi:hypothetical protein